MRVVERKIVEEAVTALSAIIEITRRAYLLICVITVAVEPWLIARVRADSASLVPCEGVFAELCLIYLCGSFFTAVIFVGILRLSLVELFLECLHVERCLLLLG